MLKAQHTNTRRQATSTTANIPAPVKGLNALSQLSDMEPDFASILTNWFPERGYLRPRRGHIVHGGVYGASSAVESLMTWTGPTSSKLFGACGTAIYDFTSGSPGGAEVSSLTNARWQHVNFATSGGHFLFCVNGADSPRHYNGTTWATPTITGDGTFSASEFVAVAAHKRRLWFAITGTTKAAYLSTDSVAGTAQPFELGSLFTMGGYLQALGSWTLDSGNGPDDYMVFVSSLGQAAIYQGTDPSSATTWALVGVFNLSPPIGRRCLYRVAGDLALISVNGVLPFSRAISLDRSSIENSAIMAQIVPLITQDARNSSDVFGWQLIAYPKGSAAILNVPETEGVSAHQYVMNTLTRAPCKFTGLNATCWEIYDDRPFFGGADGIVYEFDIGSRDVRYPVVPELRCAFNYLGARGYKKQFHMVRPLLTTDGDINFSVSVDTDFSNVSPAAPSVGLTTPNPKWNQVQWDNFQWGGGKVVSAEWLGVSGKGYSGAVRMKVSAVADSDISLWDDTFIWDQSTWDANGQDDIDVQLQGFDVLVNRGGIV